MKIKLIANPDDAPNCVKIAKIHSNGKPVVYDGEADTELVQQDWDWPGVAASFGWSPMYVRNVSVPTCNHTETDGTIPCPSCHLSAGAFIEAARIWIDNNDGATTDDPGYFE